MATSRTVFELVVVVLGVIIGLALNDWSAARGDRRLERQYLQRLQAELREDSVRTNGQWLPGFGRKSNALDTVYRTIHDQLPITDTVAFFKAVGMGGVSGMSGGGYTSRATFDDLKSTGNLRLIRNGDLRGEIVSFYNNAASQEDRIRARLSGYAMFVHGIYPAELRDSLDMPALRRTDVARAFRLLRSPEFDQKLHQEVNLTIFMKRTLRELAARNDTLLLHVTRELPH